MEDNSQKQFSVVLRLNQFDGLNGELKKFEQHATTDALTGLSNRHSMEESFLREIARCEQDGHPVSLIMIDVDNFKVFNDQFGHVAGDRALSAVASILRHQFRPRDLLVRFGGDEFAVLLPEVDEKLALIIADRVREAVCGTTGDGSDSLIQIPVKISMGVAQLEAHGLADGQLVAVGGHEHAALAQVPGHALHGDLVRLQQRMHAGGGAPGEAPVGLMVVGETMVDAKILSIGQAIEQALKG